MARSRRERETRRTKEEATGGRGKAKGREEYSNAQGTRREERQRSRHHDKHSTSTTKSKRTKKNIPGCAPFYAIAVKRTDRKEQTNHHGESEDDADDGEDKKKQVERT